MREILHWFVISHPSKEDFSAFEHKKFICAIKLSFQFAFLSLKKPQTQNAAKKKSEMKKKSLFLCLLCIEFCICECQWRWICINSSLWKCMSAHHRNSTFDISVDVCDCKCDKKSFMSLYKAWCCSHWRCYMPKFITHSWVLNNEQEKKCRNSRKSKIEDEFGIGDDKNVSLWRGLDTQ